MSSEDEEEFFMEDEDFGSEEPSPQPKIPKYSLQATESCSDDISDTSSPAMKSSNSTTWLVDKQIRHCIRELREVISTLSYDEALIILNEFGWDLGATEEKWFENCEAVRTKSGLASSAPQMITANGPWQCGICLQPLSGPAVGLSACMHSFCESCYTEYLSQKIQESQESIRTRCPSFKCPLVIPQSMIKHLVSREIFSKYLDWLRNYYVSCHQKNLKWCPNPAGCGRLANKQSAHLVNCGCGFDWCWDCALEFHEPVSCDLARQWAEKNSSESENVTWILANTKPCPHCRKPIEKHQGCNHMTCPKRSGGCGFEFCWMCLGDWRSHGNSTGGYYRCNQFASSSSSVAEEVEAKRKESKAILDKYMFYFSRFMNHHKAESLAKKELEEQSSKWMETLHEKFKLEIGDLEFIQEALQQVATCRHVLKYTYVYGFYLKEDPTGLFEYLQKNLEEFTDRLHEYVEKDLVGFYIDDQDAATPPISPPPFEEFRSTVANQCSVTKKFFKQIVDELSAKRTSSFI